MQHVCRARESRVQFPAGAIAVRVRRVRVRRADPKLFFSSFERAGGGGGGRAPAPAGRQPLGALKVTRGGAASCATWRRGGAACKNRADVRGRTDKHTGGVTSQTKQNKNPKPTKQTFWGGVPSPLTVEVPAQDVRYGVQQDPCRLPRPVRRKKTPRRVARPRFFFFFGLAKASVRFNALFPPAPPPPFPFSRRSSAPHTHTSPRFPLPG